MKLGRHYVVLIHHLSLFEHFSLLYPSLFSLDHNSQIFIIIVSIPNSEISFRSESQIILHSFWIRECI